MGPSEFTRGGSISKKATSLLGLENAEDHQHKLILWQQLERLYWVYYKAN